MTLAEQLVAVRFVGRAVVRSMLVLLLVKLLEREFAVMLRIKSAAKLVAMTFALVVHSVCKTYNISAILLV